MWCKLTNTIFLLIAIGFLPACNRTEPLGKICGKVTLDDKPVTEGLIVFSNPAKGVHILASLQTDGGYELQTANGFGLPLGNYSVSISPPLPTPPMPGAPQLPPMTTPLFNIPPKYTQPATSGLATTIDRGENIFNINMLSH